MPTQHMNGQRCLWHRGNLGVLSLTALYGLGLGLFRIAPNGYGNWKAAGNRR